MVGKQGLVPKNKINLKRGFINSITRNGAFFRKFTTLVPHIGFKQQYTYSIRMDRLIELSDLSFRVMGVWGGGVGRGRKFVGVGALLFCVGSNFLHFFSSNFIFPYVQVPKAPFFFVRTCGSREAFSHIFRGDAWHD